MARIETLVVIHQHPQILLAMKKERKNGKNFGVGKWNGFGGGIEDKDNGSLEEAVCREGFEEGKIYIKNPEKIGKTLYRFEGNEEDHLVHIYVAEKFDGEPTETDEMMPKWFDVSDIPYDRMWENDRYWMPYLLRREKFNAEICMTAKGGTLSCMINGKEYIENGN